MTLEEEFYANDMEDILDRMNAYAYNHLRRIGVKDLRATTPLDLVGEVILKVIEGDRDWPNAKCSFKVFLFGCLKSHLNNYAKSHRPVFVNELPEIRDGEATGDEAEIVIKAIEMLKTAGSDTDEITVFECWCEGITKPAEIADFFDRDVKDVYNIEKRLERRLAKLKPQISKII